MVGGRCFVGNETMRGKEKTRPEPGLGVDAGMWFMQGVFCFAGSIVRCAG